MASHSSGAPKGDGNAEPVSCCVACGERGGELKKCAACKSVHYCNVVCQRGHHKVHKAACKQRAAELAIQDLKNYVPLPREECPICMLPLPLSNTETAYKSCCGKRLCYGCSRSNLVAQVKGGATIDHATWCAFCREPYPDSMQNKIARITARVGKNDPKAMFVLAGYYLKGKGMPMDKHKAFSLYCRAANLGDPEAAARLFECHNDGIVVRRDESKAGRFLKQAVDGGHVISRHNLGILEASQGNNRAATLHFRIAAAAGHDLSLEALKHAYKGGHVSKEELAGSLRDFQAAQDEMKSEAREKFRKSNLK